MNVRMHERIYRGKKSDEAEKIERIRKRRVISEGKKAFL